MRRVKEATLEHVVWLCDKCLGEVLFVCVVEGEGDKVHQHMCTNGHYCKLSKVYPYYTIDGVPLKRVV